MIGCLILLPIAYFGLFAFATACLYAPIWIINTFNIEGMGWRLLIFAIFIYILFKVFGGDRRESYMNVDAIDINDTPDGN